jgi:hypothetical protein
MKIMKIQSLYLDTSVISAYFDHRAPERMNATKIFIELILPNYAAKISTITIDEINETGSKELKESMHLLIENMEILKVNSDIELIADDYIKQSIFPEKYYIDALHVAIATYYQIPFLISWNFEHLVKVKTRKRVNLVNNLLGYREIEIISPQEL